MEREKNKMVERKWEEESYMYNLEAPSADIIAKRASPYRLIRLDLLSDDQIVFWDKLVWYIYDFKALVLQVLLVSQS